MTVFIMSPFTVLDGAKMKEYAAAAGPIVAEYGGQISKRGRFLEALAGDHGGDGIGLIEFPDADAARAWYHSDVYQELIPLRSEACDITFTLYEVV